ncbi:MAG: uridylate kinase [Methylococcales symbiont of Hymedesmia sp. n. MRB-2018]|nr:MAG: uridylate kinase [Methylococcales symbiont of Hymedesmia sp. n. MRB-2018]
MKVIKLGGSLMSDRATLKNCLDSIEQNSQDKIVIVPGGGVFADQVRTVQKQWQFNEQIAHEMAILAMQQMALLFKSIKTTFQTAKNITAIQQAWLKYSVVIWSPDIKYLNESSIKANWSVSSDSLAAWLAKQLKAEELILVKSADIPLLMDIQTQQQQGILDLAFAEFVKDVSFKVTVINKYCLSEVIG